jgi:hypothetical protein
MAAKFDSLDSLQPSWRDGSSFLEAGMFPLQAARLSQMEK